MDAATVTAALALVTQVLLLIGAAVAVPQLFKGMRRQEAQMTELHVSMNSRLDQLLDSERLRAVSEERAAVAARSTLPRTRPSTD